MDTDLNSTTQTSMNTSVTNYSVSSKIIDEAQKGLNESYWTFDTFPKYLGYYKTIPELKKAIDAFATWVIGRGFDAGEEVDGIFLKDFHGKIILDNIKGWGEDTFNSILWNMLVMKKINGDAFAEIIRDVQGNLINLKPLNPSNMRVCVSPEGLIIGYDYMQKTGKYRRFKPEEIFHLVNDRIANEIHGVSVIESCQWVIDAKNEAMADWRRILHRSTIRVMYIDADDASKLTQVKTQYADAIKNGELMIIPAKKGEAEFQDLVAPPLDAFLSWIRHLQDFFYQAVGVPKVIIGGTAENTEASAKVGVIVFDPIFTREITELEADVWNQLLLRIKIRVQPSLLDSMQSSEAANTGQTGFQPNEAQVSPRRTE